MKTCKKCNRNLPINKFKYRSNIQSVDGHSKNCKQCIRIMHRKKKQKIYKYELLICPRCLKLGRFRNTMCSTCMKCKPIKTCPLCKKVGAWHKKHCSRCCAKIEQKAFGYRDRVGMDKADRQYFKNLPKNNL